MRIRGRFFFPICKEFEKLIYLRRPLKKKSAYLGFICRDIFPGFFIHIAKKNKKIFCGYKKRLYICIVKRCGDFRKTLKDE